jgi:division protein CdvB (Snf7/Vps24/ESCRT-III family)
MPFPKLRRNTNNQATRRANTLRKISSENLTLGGDRAHEIASRIQNMRTTRFETDFKTLIKKLGDREKIVPQRLDKRNTPKSHRLTHLHRAH